MASVSNPPTATASTPVLQTFVPQSSFLALVEYDQANIRMTTWLKSGAIYQHICLKPDFEAFRTAHNHGKHWSKNINGVKSGICIKSAKSAKSERRK